MHRANGAFYGTAGASAEAKRARASQNPEEMLHGMVRSQQNVVQVHDYMVLLVAAGRRSGLICPILEPVAQRLVPASILSHWSQPQLLHLEERCSAQASEAYQPNLQNNVSGDKRLQT